MPELNPMDVAGVAKPSDMPAAIEQISASPTSNELTDAALLKSQELLRELSVLGLDKNLYESKGKLAEDSESTVSHTSLWSEKTSAAEDDDDDTVRIPKALMKMVLEMWDKLQVAQAPRDMVETLHSLKVKSGLESLASPCSRTSPIDSLAKAYSTSSSQSLSSSISTRSPTSEVFSPSLSYQGFPMSPLTKSRTVRPAPAPARTNVMPPRSPAITHRQMSSTPQVPCSPRVAALRSPCLTHRGLPLEAMSPRPHCSATSTSACSLVPSVRVCVQSPPASMPPLALCGIDKAAGGYQSPRMVSVAQTVTVTTSWTVS